MHPATPLIPAIWSSSKHAGDVKIPHLDMANNRPLNQNGWGEEKEGGWRMEECSKGVLKEEAEEGVVAQGGGGGWAVACVIHTSRRHCY